MSQNTFVLPPSFAIPTMPAIADRISSTLQDPNVGLSDVARVVAHDAPLAAKVLKIANSTFYGLSERCTSTQQATTVLGTRVLRNVLLQASIIQQYEHLKSRGVDLDRLWRHSIVTAQTCSFLVQNARKKIQLAPEEAYTCGLLHDLGEVVLIDNLKEAYVEIWMRAQQSTMPLYMLEKNALGFTHCDVGAKVTKQWGLPPTVVRAVGAHHGRDAEIEAHPIVALISRTDHLVERLSGGNPREAVGSFTPKIAALLGIDAACEQKAIEFATHALQTVEV
jgi:putative nucleotidyltransferase with HDIG domain